MSSRQNHTDNPASQQPPKRRRRWPWVLLVIAAVLIVLVLTAPYILSTGLGPPVVTSLVNSYIAGQAEAADLSLTWTGPSSVDGLRLYDPQGRPVLAGNLAWSKGLWALITGYQQFGQLDADVAELVVYQQDQTVSIAEAVESPQPAPAEPNQPPAADYRGTLTLNVASIRIVRPDGQETEIRDLDSRVDVDTLNNLQGQIQLTLTQGGQLTSRFNLQDMFPDGSFQFGAGHMDLQAQTPEPVAVGPIAVAAGAPPMTGTLNLNADLRVEQGKPRGLIDAQVRDLTAQRQDQPPAGQLEPVDAALFATFAPTGVEAADQPTQPVDTIRQKPLWVLIDASYQPDASFAEVSWDRIVSAVLDGRPSRLEPVEVQLQGQADLARLGSAVPGLLNLREGVQITGGTLQIDSLRAAGGQTPSLDAHVRLTGLTARQNGQPVELQPVELTADAVVVEGTGLKVNQADLQSQFATVSANGTINDLTGQFQADLAQLHRQINQIVTLGDFQLAGQTSGQFTLTRPDDQRLNLNLNARAEDLLYAAEGTEIRAQQATIDGPIAMTLEDQALQTLRIDQAKLSVNQTTTAAVSMDLNAKTGAMTVRADVNSSQISDLVQVSGLENEDLRSATGSLQLQATMSRPADQNAYAINSDGAIRDLTIQDQPVGQAPIEFQLANLRIAPPQGQLSLERFEARSQGLVQAIVEDAQLAWTQQTTMEGQLQVSADVGASLAAAQPFAEWEQPPAVDGQLQWNASAKTSGQMVDVKGTATVANFQAGSGEKKFTEDRIVFEHDLSADTDNQTITLRQTKLTSTPLTAAITGTIADYLTRRILDLSGQYTASWAELTTLLHELAPGTKDLLALQGNPSREFTVTGPLAEPEFRTLQADVGVAWESGEVTGLELGQAALLPHLENSILAVPETAVPASGGTLRLAGQIDLAGDTPVYRLPGQVQLIDNVQVDQEIGKELLSRVNPLFASLTRLEGTMGLTTRDIELPLGEALYTGGSGSGTLALSKLKLTPSGFLALLIKSSGTKEQTPNQPQGQPQGQPQDAPTHQVTASDLNFTIREGRIFYDDFLVSFGPENQLAFSGSVAFDGAVNLFVSVPITAELLRKAGVSGPVEDYASILQAVPIRLPLAGNRLSPEVRWDKVDVKPLIKKAAEQILKRQAEERIGDIIKPGQKTETPTEPRPRRRAEPTPTPAPRQTPQEKIKERIKDIVEEQDKSEDESKSKPRERKRK